MTDRPAQEPRPPADDARIRVDKMERDGSLLNMRPNVSKDELWDACRVLQDNGWTGVTSMGNAIRALARTPSSVPPAAPLDYQSLWAAWEANNEGYTQLGSGFTKEQMTGAAAMLSWLIARLTPARGERSATHSIGRSSASAMTPEPDTPAAPPLDVVAAYRGLARQYHGIAHIGGSFSKCSDRWCRTAERLTHDAMLVGDPARLSEPGDGEPACTRSRHDEHCADLHWGPAARGERVHGSEGGS